MRQSRADTLVTEEPDALIAHVRVCGGAGWVTTGSTRKATASSLRSPRSRFQPRLTPGVRHQLFRSPSDMWIFGLPREDGFLHSGFSVPDLSIAVSSH